VSELSSASALQDAEALNGMTVKLRQMGFVWLDNFGTADAPLSDLSILSIDEIKLDACFMKMVGSRRNAAVLRATMALARDPLLTCVVTDVQNKAAFFLEGNQGGPVPGTLFSDSMPARICLAMAGSTCRREPALLIGR
jgi:EAL domain-containing protein (putative c-di-GMP-specific phosphodiesterase class I)